MPSYQAPLKEIRFVMNEVLQFPEHYAANPEFAEATPDLVDAILEEAGKFASEVLAPLNQIGDQQGCQWHDGVVTTPDGFKEAYAQYREGGWASLSQSPQWGGQGLPHSLGVVVSEMNGSANWSWGMYPGLSHGAMSTIETHGSDAQKNTYLPKLISGDWTGTMCLTEPHCGTDLGMLRTRAEPRDDGSFAISGTKIFISAGEHDMSDNIVHIVLARLPDSPAGTKGISLFIVPKFLPDAGGEAGERNGVSCGSIEHKMGIHGNATAVLNFDGATGFLIGEPNKGLNCMFTFMNFARIATSLQGLAHGEWGYQNSLTYAKERLQMRAANGPEYPDKPADPIIVHPEVRKMLLTQKAFAEGSRALIYYVAQQADIVRHAESQEEREFAEALLAFLTPIAKAFITEVGVESAHLAMQIYGGHGYIAEWGMEQNFRDARIGTIYEGTTQVQALDLLGRKVLMSKGEALLRFTKIVHLFCKSEQDNADLQMFIQPLAELNKEWGEITMGIGMKAQKDFNEVGAASVDYLMYSGYVTLAYFWARMARVAQQKLMEGTDDVAYYQAKMHTARFYFTRILPRTRTLTETIGSGAEVLMGMDVDQF